MLWIFHGQKIKFLLKNVKNNIKFKLAQTIHSYSKKNTLRGMHFQYPHLQGKLISVIYGKIFDVIVDIRKNSLTFGKWCGVILDSKKKKQLWIPDGFAHGFQTMTSDCQLLYFHTDFYTPQKEGAVNAFDPILKIDWPLNDSDNSERARNHTFINMR